jgi:hypothetical protein
LKPPAWVSSRFRMLVWPRRCTRRIPPFIEMGKRPFQAFTAEPQKSLTARASNATPIAVHRVARVGVLLPVPSPPIGFRDVAVDAHGFEVDQRRVAVIALVADDFFEALPVI